MTSRRAVARSTAIALAAVCLAGQLANVAHLAFVRHVTCAEHGELVHARALDDAAPETTLASAPASTGEIAAEESGHGHDHCLATTVRRESSPLQPADARLTTPSERPAVDHARDVTPVTSVALFRLAPKNSPPA